MLFSIRLKQLRKEKNLTQEDLAKILGYTRAAISGYEIGRNEPSHEVLNKLSEYFNVSVGYLTGKTDVRDIEAQKINVNENVDALYNKLTKMGKDDVNLIGNVVDCVEKGLLNQELLKGLLNLVSKNRG